MMVAEKTEEAKVLTKWTNEPKWAELNNDYTEAMADHEDFVSELEEYRELMDGGKRPKVRTGKSDILPLLIRKNAEWKYSQLEEPYLSTRDFVKLLPRGSTDTARVRQAAALSNYYWSACIDRIVLIGDSVRSLVNDGTVIVKNGWHTKKEKYTEVEMEPVYATIEEAYSILAKMVSNGEMDEARAQAMIESGEQIQVGENPVEVEKERVIENYPTHEVCDLENVIVDPTCNGKLSNANFVIHEYDTDYSELMNDKYNEETGIGFYKNLDAIDFKKDWVKEGYEEDENKDATFIFADKTRKKVRIKEYWGYWDIHDNGTKVAIVASWIGDTLVRMEENPFAHKKIPFSSTVYMPVRNKFHGQPDAPLLKENQEIIGKMTRAYLDITSTKAVGQKLVMEDTFGSTAEWAAYNAGNDARFRPGVNIDSAIKKLGVEPVDQSIFQVIQLQEQNAEALSGNQMYNKGLAGGNSSTSATGIRAANDSSARRELSILRRMSSQLIKDMIKQDIANMQVFASPEEVVNVTDEGYIAIRREDVQGEFNIVIDVSTPSKDAEIAESLSYVIQTLGDSVGPAIKNMMVADMLRLKGRPDVAKQVEEYKPQPSEAQQKMEQMQMDNLALENELLKAKVADLHKGLEEADSKIQERETRAIENQSDVKLKEAKAAEHLARQGYYDEMADAASLKFLRDQSGQTRKEEVEDMVFKEDSKKELTLAKAQERADKIDKMKE